MFTCLPDYLLAVDNVGGALQLHNLPTLQIHPMHASSSRTRHMRRSVHSMPARLKRPTRLLAHAKLPQTGLLQQHKQ